MVGVRTLVLPTVAFNRVVLAVRNYEWDVVSGMEHKRELEVKAHHGPLALLDQAAQPHENELGERISIFSLNVEPGTRWSRVSKILVRWYAAGCL